MVIMYNKLGHETSKVSAVIAFTMVAAATTAADLIVEAPVVMEETYDWSGFYVGAHAGWGRGKKSGSDKEGCACDTTGIPGVPSEPFGDGDHDLDGWFGGGQVGYMWHGANNWVGGLEADASFASIEHTDENVIDVTGSLAGRFGVKTSTKINMFGTVHGKVGYAYDRFLPFVTGGIAWANITSTFTNDNGLSPATTSSSSATHFGWAAGAGVEYAIDDHWRTKLEYRYHDFGKSFNHAYKTDTKTTLHTIQVGLNYKF